ncbi:hypothetical protein [Cupriavidus sp. L7L]|uniref:hypothetical protein n=1 Tax=Cupriavidus sp. L7L TaxID=2546443 RepID=UPI00105575D4|nr:hypothetical protein [Cupriavidus sp. L7L]TDF65193.1 hypothetical protein E1J61_15070 [Cupriavidus sp. L7L]
MKLFNKLIRPPSALTSDRYALSQVALYIFALVLGVTAAFQMVAALSTPATQIPFGENRLLLYASPAIQNFFWSCGMIYLSHKLQNDPSELAWKLCIGIMLMQILVTILQMIASANALSLMALALAIFGLGSLLVGKDSSPADEGVCRGRELEE